MKSLKLLLIMSFSLFLSGCKKNSEEPKTTTELLTLGPWKMIEETWNPNNAGWTDFYPGVPTCLKDNSIAYHLDLSVLADEGPTKCNVSDPQTIPGTWYLYPTGTKYSVTINGSTTDYDILELNEHVLKIYFKVTATPSVTEYKATLIH